MDYDGTCDNTTESLTIKFLKTWMLSLVYTLSGADKTASYQMTSVELKYAITQDLFPEADPSEFGKHYTWHLVNQTLFTVKKGSSYKCFANSTIKDNKQTDVVMSLANFQAQAFMDGTKTKFDTGKILAIL